MTDSGPPIKGFDCVQFMRDARARLDAQTQGMAIAEEQKWRKARRLEDPWLRKILERDRTNPKPISQPSCP